MLISFVKWWLAGQGGYYNLTNELKLDMCSLSPSIIEIFTTNEERNFMQYFGNRQKNAIVLIAQYLDTDPISNFANLG